MLQGTGSQRSFAGSSEDLPGGHVQNIRTGQQDKGRNVIGLRSCPRMVISERREVLPFCYVPTSNTRVPQFAIPSPEPGMYSVASQMPPPEGSSTAAE